MPITFTARDGAPADADVLAVPVFESPELPVAAEVDRVFLEAQGFEAKPGDARLLPRAGGGLLAAVGMGAQARVTLDTFRMAGAAVARAAWRSRHVAADLLGAVPASLDGGSAAAAFAEGVGLAAYGFDEYKRGARPCSLETVTVIGDPGQLRARLERAGAVVKAVSLARDLVNQPAGALPPSGLAAAAEEVARTSDRLHVTVWGPEQLEAERLNALLGVARGSTEPARLIRLEYEPEHEARATVALVGKGITFDSGGLSIKTAEGMMTMKTDMSGAAAVLAAMSALPALQPPVRVIAIIPATENMPSGRAVKPGDVLRARNGTTIEVLNTDAEGRLVLADGLALAVEAAPDAIVDLATLTGAQIVALGRRIAAVMGTSEPLVEQVRRAAHRAGEPVWPLPLPSEYRSHLDSEIADIKNIGNPGQAGTIIGGLFLQEFVGDVPWVHLDIAGPARADADEGYIRKGGTGFGVRLLLELLDDFERPPRRDSSGRLPA